METEPLYQSLERAKEIADQYKLEDRFSLIKKLNQEFSDPMEIEFMIAAFQERIEPIEQQINQLLQRVQKGELTWNQNTQEEYGEICVARYQLEILAGSLSIILEAHKQRYPVDDILDQLEKLHENGSEERVATIKRFLKTKAALRVTDLRFMEKRPIKRGMLPTTGQPDYEICTRIMAVVEDLRKTMDDTEAEEKKQTKARISEPPLISKIEDLEPMKPQEEPQPLPESEQEQEMESQADLEQYQRMDALYDAVTYRYDQLRDLGIDIYEHVHYLRIDKHGISAVISRAKIFAERIGLFADIIRPKKKRITVLISELEHLSKTIDQQQARNREQA